MADTVQTDEKQEHVIAITKDLVITNDSTKNRQMELTMDINIDMITCPISKLLFRNPVMAMDGHIYEELFIEEWFSTKKTSPLTNIEIVSTLVPAHKMKELVDAICEKYPQLAKDRASNKHMDNKELIKTFISKGSYERLLRFEEFCYREIDKDDLIKFVKNASTSIMKHFIQNCQDSCLTKENNKWNLYWYILVHRSSSDLFEWILDNIDLTEQAVISSEVDWTIAKITFRYASKACILKMIQKYKVSFEGSMSYSDNTKTNVCKTMNENDKLGKSDVIEIMQVILETYNGWTF